MTELSGVKQQYLGRIGKLALQPPIRGRFAQGVDDMARRTAQADAEAENNTEGPNPNETPATTPETVAEPVQETEEQKRERKVLAPLDFSAIHINRTVTAETAAKFRHTKAGKERDGDQQAADDLVLKAYGAWVEAGKPQDWAEALVSAGMHIRLRDDQLEPFKARVQRGGTFHDKAIRFGKVLPSEGHEGHVETVFYAKDKPVKNEGEEQGGSEEE